MNVYKNMAFSLRRRRLPKAEVLRRVQEAAAILGITDLLDRKPKALSGGQRQRVAIGRAIVRQPAAFLFDEPLSNLDAKLRVQMRAELAKLHQRLEQTIVYVTHDQIEAMTLADRIVVMNQGRVMQIGTPVEVYDNPRNLFVAGFIGSPAMNFIEVRVMERDGGLYLAGENMELAVPEHLRDRFGRAGDREAVFGIRPEHIFDGRTREPFPGAERLTVNIEVTEFVGSGTILMSTCGSDQVTACVDPKTGARPQSQMEFLVDMNNMYLFDQATGDAY